MVSPKSDAIVNGIAAGLCLLDKKHRIVWLNATQSSRFGGTCSLLGKHCYKYFEHRKHICKGCPAEKVFQTGLIQTANRIGITKEGQKRYYHLTVSPIKDNNNNVVFALELAQDVTANIIKDRVNLKIIQKMRHTHQHLSAVNKGLRYSIKKLKSLTRNYSALNQALEKKFHKSNGQLSVIKEELQDIFKVNRVLNSSVGLKKATSLITSFTCQLMHTDICVLRLLDSERQVLVPQASFGLGRPGIESIPIDKIGYGISGLAAKEKKPLSVDIEKDERVLHKDILRKLGIKSILAVPVMLQNEILGVISTYSKTRVSFSNEEIDLFGIFASQAAIAIEESKHYNYIRKNYYDTIHALVLAIEARDPFTRGHTERVTKYALAVGRQLRMAESDLEILRYGAEVHDLGKISIPDFILNKPGRLSPAERAMIELHPGKGAEMLEPLEFLNAAIPIVRHHHERYDGTGYPDGLEKDNIPVMARILSCADAFDAMTQDRPYRRRKLTVKEALAEIKNNIGSQFDPHIANVFIKTIRSSLAPKALA